MEAALDNKPFTEAECILYEHPLNERVRMFLRLEYLFKQAAYHVKHGTEWDSRATLSCILEILSIAGNTNLKSEVLKELERHSSSLKRLEKNPGIDKGQLLEAIGAVLVGRRPNLPTFAVCMECKARGTTCIMVSKGIPCMGPVTQAGCNALCPTYDRGCYGCFGPMESANAASLANQWEVMGLSNRQMVDALRGFNAWSEAFRVESDRRETAIEIGGAR